MHTVLCTKQRRRALFLSPTPFLHTRNGLTQKKDFERVKRWGNVYRGVYFTLLVCFQVKQRATRFGFIVSNKIGKATYRNRVRRRLKEAVRTMSGSTKDGFDAIIVGRQKAYSCTSQELKREIVFFFKKSGLFYHG